MLRVPERFQEKWLPVLRRKRGILRNPEPIYKSIKRLSALSIAKLVFLLLAASACAQSDSASGFFGPSDKVAVITSSTGEHKFKVEIADDDDERRTGLMYRTEMARDAGMLFDFEVEQPLSMWMKNTLIPLDMAFIDEDGVIIRIAANTTPRSLESIKSGAPALAVLEVNGGVFGELGIKPGDTVKHPIFKDQK
jgi:uncharacterized membrane protein (UPF0127 family)